MSDIFRAVLGGLGGAGNWARFEQDRQLRERAQRLDEERFAENNKLLRQQQAFQQEQGRLEQRRAEYTDFLRQHPNLRGLRFDVWEALRDAKEPQPMALGPMPDDAPVENLDTLTERYLRETERRPEPISTDDLDLTTPAGSAAYRERTERSYMPRSFSAGDYNFSYDPPKPDINLTPGWLNNPFALEALRGAYGIRREQVRGQNQQDGKGDKTQLDALRIAQDGLLRDMANMTSKGYVARKNRDAFRAAKSELLRVQQKIRELGGVEFIVTPPEAKIAGDAAERQGAMAPQAGAPDSSVQSIYSEYGLDRIR